ncbi:MAG: M23 family metallopeptidase [Deltaproteobacteria bacterium]|nr:M23 family metallopeptidase [Deltaproteobacteria bacterium]
MDTKPKRSYTVVLVGEREVRRVTVPAWLLSGRIIALAAITAILGIGHYLYSFQQAVQVDGLMSENSELRAQVAAVEARLATLDRQIDRAGQLESRIRRIVGIDPAPRQPESGTGGPRVAGEAQLYSTFRPEDAARLQRIDADLASYSSRSVRAEMGFEVLLDYFKSQEMQILATPTIWPVRGWVTSTFGYRIDPFTGERRLHEGLDISSAQGTVITAPASGTVIRSGMRDAYGLSITIDHGYGLTTIYAHMSETLVKVGEKVIRGQNIGAVGSTGRSTGPHLHYEVRVNDIPVDPFRYILN